MPNKAAIAKSYQKFSSAEGNLHIASEYVLIKLQELINYFQPVKVLEVGLGIGSIAGTLLELNPDLDYTGTEANGFCLQALPGNLGKNYERLQIFPFLDEVPEKEKFYLIIIDGKDPNLEKLADLISRKGMIVIEGDRLPQQKILEKLFPENNTVHSISLSKNKSNSPFPKEEWQGGLKIIFANPTNVQWVWYIKEKVLTKLKYQYPGRYFGSGQIEKS